ncbi:mechanosensitive ion channel family protein [Pontibacter sp. 172403-2]|uniref:mechanosensitive ion channel family protein n=1 Tax=Pontibacter rufus TaxID=2791028 RepID=UPI0018AFE1D8|nr:mechanosensitive ion channel family protein [Pontibacter sp. 172403-2]MBF9253419.1 mechanosensitive ion channel family protein [Pontibacter sp. 172403-2]
MNEVLERIYFHNTVKDYIIVVACILVALLLVRLFKRTILIKISLWTEKTKFKFDNYLIGSFERFGIPIINICIVYVGINYLTLSARADKIIDIATTVAITILVIRFVSSALSLVVGAYFTRKHHTASGANEMGAINLIIGIIIWFIGLGFLFDNLGYDLTAIIAGLGVGGIAVALAAQNILGDLFNYFVIFLDRPFEVGDFLVVGNENGTVEHIGVKTTRIRTLSGEQLVFSNSDLTSSRIHNFKTMQKRRVVFKIGVTYQTSYENVEKIPELLKSIVEEQEPVKFDRAHFASYGDSSLDYEIVYYVLDPDYNKYMDIQQAINLSIYKQFAALGIEIAFPTRTLFVVNQQEDEQEKEPVQPPSRQGSEQQSIAH